MLWLDIASVIGIAIFIFGFGGALMMGSLVIGAVSAVCYALIRLVRWMLDRITA